MKKKKTIFISVSLILLSGYVLLYCSSVKPYDPEASKVYMQLSRGWNPTYTYCKNPPKELPHQIVPGKWNDFARKFFTPIHRIDRFLRSDLWLDEEEKHEITLRASQPLEGPLQIYSSGFVMDGGSILIDGVDRNLTGFIIILHRSIKMSRENTPQYITINGRKLERNSKEEQQLAIDLSNWLENPSGEASEHIVEIVKEIVDSILDKS